MRIDITRGLLTIVALGFLAALAGCGGGVDLTCDEPRNYQKAVEHERVRTPDDLDALQPYREMPVPAANPRPERPKGSPCLDLPPNTTPSE
jgi:hypothetical protein